MIDERTLSADVYAAIAKVYDRECDIEDAVDAVLEIIEADRKRRGEPVAYHPCTSILIEGLKRLPGGSAILAEWDKARSKVDAPQPAEPVKVPSDAEILELSQPFGVFQYGDAQGCKRIEFARALLARYGSGRTNISKDDV